MSPSEGSRGVEAHLAITTRPSPSTAARSVKVPPTSTPIRYTRLRAPPRPTEDDGRIGPAPEPRGASGRQSPWGTPSGSPGRGTGCRRRSAPSRRRSRRRRASSPVTDVLRSEEHTSELQSRLHLVCRLLLEKKKKK